MLSERANNFFGDKNKIGFSLNLIQAKSILLGNVSIWINNSQIGCYNEQSPLGPLCNTLINIVEQQSVS